MKIFRTLGTPNDDVWPGLTSMFDFKPSFPRWPIRHVRESLDGVLDPAGEALLAAMFTYNPSQRITARAALAAEWLREDRCVMRLHLHPPLPPPPPPPPQVASSAAAAAAAAETEEGEEYALYAALRRLPMDGGDGRARTLALVPRPPPSHRPHRRSVAPRSSRSRRAARGAARGEDGRGGRCGGSRGAGQGRD